MDPELPPFDFELLVFSTNFQEEIPLQFAPLITSQPSHPPLQSSTPLQK